MSGYQLHILSPKRCHCDGTGLVIVDGTRSAMGEPCPMCTLGARRSAEYVGQIDQTPPPLDLKDPRQVSADHANTSNMKPMASWVNRDGKPIRTPNYYADVAVHELAWNNGLTVFDRYDCADRFCSGWASAPRTDCRSCKKRRSGEKVPRFSDIVAQINGQAVRSALTPEERVTLLEEIATERSSHADFVERAKGDDREPGAA